MLSGQYSPHTTLSPPSSQLRPDMIRMRLSKELLFVSGEEPPASGTKPRVDQSHGQACCSFKDGGAAGQPEVA